MNIRASHIPFALQTDLIWQKSDALIAPTDYSNTANWLSIPQNSNKNIDVFFAIPTTWTRTNPSAPPIAVIESGCMTKGAMSSLATQASAFSDIGNIYAPYYRQADTMFCLTMPIDEQIKFIGGIPATDVTDAFDYYINNYNKGKPFIIAGHSQGSNALLFTLSDYMRKHADVLKRMIAAYIIGYSVTDKYLADNPHLKFAESATDTGVIISYNTEMPGMTAKNPTALEGGISINPLTWTRTEQPAGIEHNLGSNKRGRNGLFEKINGIADATVSLARGSVICSTVNPDNYSIPIPVFPKGVYHGSDYDFYYYNIKQNASDRVACFFRG